MSLNEILLIIPQAILLFILGVFGFDGVHYILHVWEHSRFRLLRFLGGLHAVHHEFLDREMKIRPQFMRANLLNHVIPEYLTGATGSVLLAAILGWWSAGAAVVVVRTVMVIFYLLQKGKDFTHNPVNRIRADRSLVFVGPAYHALHHVYVRQHYSSFINIFDFVFGTNCQIEGRNFLVFEDNQFTTAVQGRIKKSGAVVHTVSQNPEEMRRQMESSEVMILTGQPERETLIRDFTTIGKARLMPPEVWDFAPTPVFKKPGPDLIYRHIRTRDIAVALFLIRRGFRSIP